MSRRRVLLADDSRDTIESLKILFEVEGCEVQVCESGREVLQCALDFRPHVAILDLDFGSGPDGVEVITQLRAHPELTGLVITAVTGWTRPSDKNRALEAGCDNFFHKPVHPDELIRIVLTLDRRRNTSVVPWVERRAAAVNRDAENPERALDRLLG